MQDDDQEENWQSWRRRINRSVSTSKEHGLNLDRVGVGPVCSKMDVTLELVHLLYMASSFLSCSQAPMRLPDTVTRFFFLSRACPPSSTRGQAPALSRASTGFCWSIPMGRLLPLLFVECRLACTMSKDSQLGPGSARAPVPTMQCPCLILKCTVVSSNASLSPPLSVVLLLFIAVMGRVAGRSTLFTALAFHAHSIPLSQFQDACTRWASIPGQRRV